MSSVARAVCAVAPFCWKRISSKCGGKNSIMIPWRSSVTVTEQDPITFASLAQVFASVEMGPVAYEE